MLNLIIAALITESPDPITALLTRDWAGVTGWGLFIGLTMTILVGAFRGLWVPGWQYRALVKTLDEAMAQNRTLLVAADITKHFYETVAPKPGGDAR